MTGLRRSLGGSTRPGALLMRGGQCVGRTVRAEFGSCDAAAHACVAVNSMSLALCAGAPTEQHHVLHEDRHILMRFGSEPQATAVPDTAAHQGTCGAIRLRSTPHSGLLRPSTHATECHSTYVWAAAAGNTAPCTANEQRHPALCLAQAWCQAYSIISTAGPAQANGILCRDMHCLHGPA